MISVDICICTFRRPYLAETLRSVAALQADGVEIRVIVSDNDEGPSARTLVETIGENIPWPIIYLHSPAANICIARNACLDAASASYVAFIDDDEVVDRMWLQHLLRVAQRTGADAVLGPVHAIYGADVPAWMVRGDFHSTAPVVVNGSIRTGYTCNVLMAWRDPVKALRFDLALGKSGGEDTDFFYRLTAQGGTIAQAPEALVFEPVPAERAAMSWLLKRRIRSGQTHGMLLAERPLPALAVAGAKAGYCLAMTGITAFSPVGRRRNMLRAALHIGVMRGILGMRQAVLYGHGGAR